MTKSPHTLVYTHGGGRLGNQVVRFAHWIAWALEHPGEVEVLNLSFWPYAHFFSTWCDAPSCIFPTRRHALDGLGRLRRGLPEWWQQRLDWRSQRCAHALGRTWPGWQAMSLDDVAGESADLEAPEFLSRVKRRRLTACSGWKIAGWNLVARHEAEIRAQFLPAPEFAGRAEDFVSALRAEHDLVIGVLIRQSDYREWDDGRFYFPTAQYSAWIGQLLALHSERKVAFIVASEERQDPALFAGLPVHQATGNPGEGGHWFENWVELSRCDFVVSAPSTFSATAAFLGSVPLWPVTSADQTMALSQIITGGLAGAARHPVFSRSVK